jgi:hypothetical protein
MQLSGYSFVLKEVLGNVPKNHLNPAYYELKDDGEPLSVCFNRCVPICVMTSPLANFGHEEDCRRDATTPRITER